MRYGETIIFLIVPLLAGNVILFRGRAGVGKTTLSSALGKRLQIMVIHEDDIFDKVATDRYL